MSRKNLAPRIWIFAGITAVAVGAIFLFGLPGAAPYSVTFSRSTPSIEPYDFVEITANVAAPRAQNPFTGASISGTFQMHGSGKRWRVEGFCDSRDGSIFRVRFMPAAPGDYEYSVEYRQGWSAQSTTGSFHVKPGHRRGPIRVDSRHPWHFMWEGTGEHYFFNGTTAYWLLGWRDAPVIDSIIERLHRLRINRMRVTVAGRTNQFYGEPVVPGNNWTPLLMPWEAGRTQRLLHYFGRAAQTVGFGWGWSIFENLANQTIPDDIYHPGFDYSRFDVSYWRKFEGALRYARDRDMIFSLVLDMNDSRVHPAPGSEDERRFIRYAIARFGAFSNITWDLGDDLDRFRDDAWTHATGLFIKDRDPYRHLATSHPVENIHQDRTSGWFDFTSFQDWSRNQHAFMLAQRKQQQNLGRIIPQTNEEYGYEDHYPLWTAGIGSDSADVLRRTAWDIVMAGGYQTAGETARRGTNILPDTGGGWMNGRGDETMTMLEGYAHMVDFITSFDWWKTNPHDELVDKGAYCLAEPGSTYAIYLPHGGRVTVKLAPGRYEGKWMNAVTGEQTALPPLAVTSSSWASPAVSASNDWALLLQRMNEPETRR